MLDTGCCGTNLRTNTISFWGYFTLAYPLLIIMVILYPLLMILPKETKTKGSIILRSLYDMSKRMIILPKVKLFFSTNLYKVSPGVSGFTFRNFNLFFVSLIWFFLIAFVVGVNNVF